VAAARALLAEGREVIAVDDDPGASPRDQATELGIELVATPDRAELSGLLCRADLVVVSPGVPASHPVFSLRTGPMPISEVELAWQRSSVPIVAVTGTNGKTTVVTLVTAMLQASGIAAVAAGNIGHPLVEAVTAPADVIVAEVSSFQLAFTVLFRPPVAAWINFSPDHLDWHPTLQHYQASKARVWANAGPGDIAVVNADDPVVASYAPDVARHGAAVVSFGTGRRGDWRVEDGALVGPDGEWVADVADLPRSGPHDLANALSAMAIATAAGARTDGCRRVLLEFVGLPHRVQFVGEAGGVRFYDDSKATTPGAVLACLAGFPSAVLIAGGRNKGLDLGELAAATPRLRGVVAIGEAAAELVQVFNGRCPVAVASSMEQAVRQARVMAIRGDAIVLSPACASFDWYRSYAERGEDFVRCVRHAIGESLGVHAGGHP
jgi:UDP-N-acetylmuramoylalanine--D-glutamate ligase